MFFTPWWRNTLVAEVQYSCKGAEGKEARTFSQPVHQCFGGPKHWWQSLPMLPLVTSSVYSFMECVRFDGLRIPYLLFVDGVILLA